MTNRVLAVLYTDNKTPIEIRKQFVTDTTRQLLTGLPFETSIGENMVLVTIFPPVMWPQTDIQITVCELPISLLEE